jgi:hypothetical protein
MNNFFLLAFEENNIRLTLFSSLTVSLLAQATQKAERREASGLFFIN